MSQRGATAIMACVLRSQRSTVETAAKRVLPSAKKDQAAGDWTTRYTVADYRVTEDKVDSSLDLLAVCRR